MEVFLNLMILNEVFDTEFVRTRDKKDAVPMGGKEFEDMFHMGNHLAGFKVV